MKKIELMDLNREKLQKEGYDFVFQYYIYTRKKEDDGYTNWKLEPGNITSYEPEIIDEELRKNKLVRIILVPFRYQADGSFNEIKLDEDWVPVKEQKRLLTLEQLKEIPDLELWKCE